MCELLGLSFERPLSADVSIRAFAGRGEENTDGWGLAWYPDRAAAVVKEPIRWGSSRLARFLEGYPALRSALYIAHVRHKTTGDAPTYADTHPFGREHAGRDYCFAHNGTLQGNLRDLPTGRFRPLGDTDSESAFCHLLDAVDRRGGHLDAPEDWAWLHGRLARLNDLGSLNMLLSDGRRLFAYHDRGGWKGLTHRPLKLGAEAGHLGDATMDVDLRGPAGTVGAAVATCPLDGSEWRRFEAGELIVFEAGAARFSSTRPARADVG